MNKLHILVRHNVNSPNRKKEIRPEWFSFQKCFDSLSQIHFKDDTTMSIFVDGNYNSENFHVNFTNELPHQIFNVQCGTDASSFLILLDYAKKQYDYNKWDENDIVYFVEDDYLHLPKWDIILREGIGLLKNVYVSLYDHPDKYFLPMYSELTSKIYLGRYTHWRTTPSCCNTYAMKLSTLIKDFETHELYSLPSKTFDGYDHHKFLTLGVNGRVLLSPIRGFSTHCENNLISPFFNSN